MDDSSKNIVKFVAALTGAILLLMAAWYFAKARENSDAAAAAATEASALAKEAKEKADKAEQAKLLYQRSFHFVPPVQKTQC